MCFLCFLCFLCLGNFENLVLPFCGFDGSSNTESTNKNTCLFSACRLIPPTRDLHQIKCMGLCVCFGTLTLLKIVARVRIGPPQPFPLLLSQSSSAATSPLFAPCRGDWALGCLLALAFLARDGYRLSRPGQANKPSPGHPYAVTFLPLLDSPSSP